MKSCYNLYFTSSIVDTVGRDQPSNLALDYQVSNRDIYNHKNQLPETDTPVNFISQQHSDPASQCKT